MRAFTRRVEHSWLTLLGKFSPIVNCTLIIAIAYSLAQLTWSITAPAKAKRPLLGGATTVNNDSNNTNAFDIAAISSLHLFGVSVAEPVSTKVVVKTPETKLNLRLAGIFYSQTAPTARIKPRALIAQGGAVERSYSEGDNLAAGIKIKQILPDQVVLVRNGQLESLKLPRRTETIGQDQDAQDTVASPKANNTLTTAGTTAHLNDRRPKTVKAAGIAQHLRQATQTNPERLQDLAYANPYMRNGQFVGLQLKPGRNRGLLPRLGLRSGDVLTELNGVKLTDASQSITLFQQLLQADQINAKVLRGNVEIPFTFLLTE